MATFATRALAYKAAERLRRQLARATRLLRRARHRLRGAHAPLALGSRARRALRLPVPVAADAVGVPWARRGAPAARRRRIHDPRNLPRAAHHRSVPRDLGVRAQPRQRARPRTRDRLQPLRALALPRRGGGWRFRRARSDRSHPPDRRANGVLQLAHGRVRDGVAVRLSAPLPLLDGALGRAHRANRGCRLARRAPGSPRRPRSPDRRARAAMDAALAAAARGRRGRLLVAPRQRCHAPPGTGRARHRRAAARACLARVDDRAHARILEPPAALLGSPPGRRSAQAQLRREPRAADRRDGARGARRTRARPAPMRARSPTRAASPNAHGCSTSATRRLW